MSTASKIEWTETTWNPVTGCDRISSGCDRCYALTLAKRLKAMGAQKYQADGDPRTSGPGFAVTVHQDAVREPLRWRKPRMVFVNSMSDLFHARVPDAFIAPVFAVMAATPQHTYQVLTKRPRRMRALLASDAFCSQAGAAAAARTGTWGRDWRAAADPRCRGRCRTSGSARRSRTTTTRGGPTACGRSRPLSASCPWSPCSARSRASASTASTG